MKFAFCLFNYFPYGGLQRDFLRIARACLERGHQIDVYTMRWEGPSEPGLTVYRVAVKGWQNHSRCAYFAHKVGELLASQAYDRVVGFNKMPYLDIYYAADVCYQARVREQRQSWYRLLPRYRQLVKLEQAVFTQTAQTQILLISPRQEAEYRHYYQTPPHRFHHLPPGIAADRVATVDAVRVRERIRNTHQIRTDDFLLLMVGSGFKTKGLDRAIAGVAALPEPLKKRCHLFVLGQDNATPFKALAEKSRVLDRVHFLGGCDDVPDFLVTADLLVHPAYHENTGTVLLEAAVAGLPVLTVDVCGYAHYIAQAKLGKVLSSPFKQSLFNQTMEKMLLSPERLQWQQNGLAFAQYADIYSLPQKAAEIIEHS